MLLDIIKERYSERNFSDKKIPLSHIKKILEAGRLSPSWMNVQPWHFLVVDDDNKKDLLCKIAFNQPQVKAASHLILCIADKSAWNFENFSQILKQKGMSDDAIQSTLSNPLLNPAMAGDNIALLRSDEQVAMAISYLTLAAQSLNVCSCIIGACANEINHANDNLSGELKQLLNIPDNCVITHILALGYPQSTSTQPKEKKRKDFDKIVSYNTFGDKLNV